MDELTKAEAWRNCWAMWKDVPKGLSDQFKVAAWKENWLEENRPNDDLYCSCYFCEYAFQQGDKRFPFKCPHCPAKEIDPDFSCSDTPYDYRDSPLKFRNKIEKLYKKWQRRNGLRK